jgi:hypothetical protein
VHVVESLGTQKVTTHSHLQFESRINYDSSWTNSMKSIFLVICLAKEVCVLVQVASCFWNWIAFSDLEVTLCGQQLLFTKSFQKMWRYGKVGYRELIFWTIYKLTSTWSLVIFLAMSALIPRTDLLNNL